MRILAIDVGTGTQDILLFDSDKPVENCVKLVLPSPTEVAARRIRRATAHGRAVALTGTVAGGGPCSWALEDHLRAGLAAYATPDAARTIDDDLARVREIGVMLVSDDEVRSLAAEPVALADLDLAAIRAVLAAYEEPGDFDGIAVGCLDHGAAPPGVSDRLFRFDHLRRRVEERNDLLAFASAPGDLPPYLTRAQATVSAAAGEGRVAFMDTGPAAALGALEDEAVRESEEAVVVNAGNMHLLAFHLRGRAIVSLFEHHTGEIEPTVAASMVVRLAEGSLTHEEVFATQGHGAFYADHGHGRAARLPDTVALTGPRRERLRAGGLDAHLAAPHGDMMLSGCFGLLRAFAEVYPDAAPALDSRLGAIADRGTL